VRYRFRYLVRTGIDNSVVGSGEGIVEADTDSQAIPLATQWALDNNVYADERIDPWIQLMELEKIEDGNCGRCWRCLTKHNFMIVCVDCGNKRCPKATDHDNACTGSNDPEQEGSVYGGLGPDAPSPSTTRFVEFFQEHAPKEEA
jgi:hypothetical protein